MFLIKNFNYLIKVNGDDLKKISSLMNESYRSLQNIKLGLTNNPGIIIVNKISQFFNISIDDLLNVDLESTNLTSPTIISNDHI